MALFHRSVELPVQHGRINCPFKSETSVQRCLTCPRAVSIELGASHQLVRCSLRPTWNTLAEFEPGSGLPELPPGLEPGHR